MGSLFPSILRSGPAVARIRIPLRPVTVAASSPVAATTVSRRLFSQTRVAKNAAAEEYQRDAYEQEIFDKLKSELNPKMLDVRDVSGGCGSMFAITIISEAFKGQTMIKQHRLVNSILKEDISRWHGLQLRTRAQ